LEAALHRGLNPALGFGVAHALSEEIGIATEVLDRCERGRVDAVLTATRPAAGKLAMR
jgi:hypothetical protein